MFPAVPAYPYRRTAAGAGVVPSTSAAARPAPPLRAVVFYTATCPSCREQGNSNA